MIVCTSPTESLPELSSRPTVRYPVDLSLLRAEAPWVLSGLMTDATWGALARSDAAVLTAPEYLESVSCPLGAWRMIGLVPLDWTGNDLASSSVARWLSVPGSERLSLVLSPSRWETPTSTTAATTQTIATTKRRRTQNCAMRYSTPVILDSPLWTRCGSPALPTKGDCMGRGGFVKQPARGSEVDGLSLHDTGLPRRVGGARHRQILDRQPGRIEQRHRVVPATPRRVAGEDRAELGHLLAGDEAGLDRPRQLATVGRLRPLVAEQRARRHGGELTGA